MAFDLAALDRLQCSIDSITRLISPDSFTSKEIFDTISKAIRIFSRNGLKCCLHGTAASYAYVPFGIITPKEFDLVVLTDCYDQEALKQMLVQADSKFYLVDPRDVHATFKVLWYRFHPGSNNKRCKINIFVPGILNTPNVPPEQLVSRVRHQVIIPLMPLIPLLLSRLYTWSSHRNSARADLRSKERADRHEIKELLEIAHWRGLKIRSPDLDWLPESLISGASTRLAEYLLYGLPETRPQWKALGFPV